MLSIIGKFRIGKDPNDCFVWTAATTSKGYPCVGRNGKTHLVHRILWLDSYGKIPDGGQIHHICENKLCVNIKHYQMAMPLAHAGLHSKLSENDIKVIKITYQSGHQSSPQIAAHFNIDPKSVRNILNSSRRPGISPDEDTIPLPRLPQSKYRNTQRVVVIA